MNLTTISGHGELFVADNKTITVKGKRVGEITEGAIGIINELGVTVDATDIINAKEIRFATLRKGIPRISTPIKMGSIENSTEVASAAEVLGKYTLTIPATTASLDSKVSIQIVELGTSNTSTDGRTVITFAEASGIHTANENAAALRLSLGGASGNKIPGYKISGTTNKVIVESVAIKDFIVGEDDPDTMPFVVYSHNATVAVTATPKKGTGTGRQAAFTEWFYEGNQGTTGRLPGALGVSSNKFKAMVDEDSTYFTSVIHFGTNSKFTIFGGAPKFDQEIIVVSKGGTSGIAALIEKFIARA